MNNRILVFIITFSIMILSCSKDVEDKTLKIGLMPAVDTAPFLYAQEQGLFQDAGIDVEFTIYTDAQNRQTALQTNSIDGAMTDLVALITNVSAGFPIKGTMSTDGSFPLLINPKYNELENDNPAVGLMEVSVSNYLVSEYLKDIKYTNVYINAIPMRLEAVASGQIQMGLFPEPIASIGEMKGLIKKIYSNIPKESLDIIVFTEKSINQKPNTIKIFHEVYAKAVEAIQKDPELARDILIRKIDNLPPSIKDTMELPIYNNITLPTPEFTNELISWTSETTKKEINLIYKDLFDTSYTK